MGEKKRWKPGLAQKIAALVIALIVASVSVSVWVSGQWYIDRMYENIEQNALNVVKITAKSPIIISALERERDDGSVQLFVEEIQDQLEQVDIMVVADNDGLRYGHTKADRVGLMFSAEDHHDSLDMGTTYVSIGPGTLGESLRAFTPVLSNAGDILGFVMAGTLLDSIEQAKAHIAGMIALFILLGGGVGTAGAILMARYIKRSLLGYEPEGIARLYLENRSILSAIHEGVIAINQQGDITLINDAARRCLNISDAREGQPLKEVFPLSRLDEVLKSGEAMLDVPYALGDVIAVSNNVPIVSSDGSIMGGVCTFRDQTEVNRLAQQVTGVQKIVDALRASTHEFKNKLHVILGLMETGRVDQAKAYIGSTSDAMQICVTQTLNHVFEPTISALLIGKSQRARELDIEWILRDETNFSNLREFDANSLVVITGNLIDNAMEALDSFDGEHKKIEIYINDEDGPMTLTVSDNGPGIADAGRIFQKGYTTKTGSRGYGLFLVKEQVDKYAGNIAVVTEPGEGTRFEVHMDRARIDREGTPR
ncbi:MAG: ATP-binding protein [Clostridia bacterium]|nr:ATP-binding protein [Clostridia bacterium]